MKIQTKLAGLASRRKAAGCTQAEFAEKLGVSRSLLAAWETGIAWPSARRLPEIAQLLGCSIEELYSEPGEDSVILQDQEATVHA